MIPYHVYPDPLAPLYLARRIALFWAWCVAVGVLWALVVTAVAR